MVSFGGVQVVVVVGVLVGCCDEEFLTDFFFLFQTQTMIPTTMDQWHGPKND